MFVNTITYQTHFRIMEIVCIETAFCPDLHEISMGKLAYLTGEGVKCQQLKQKCFCKDRQQNKK